MRDWYASKVRASVQISDLFKLLSTIHEFPRRNMWSKGDDNEDGIHSMCGNKKHETPLHSVRDSGHTSEWIIIRNINDRSSDIRPSDTQSLFRPPLLRISQR